jgi:hypothetical protein
MTAAQTEPAALSRTPRAARVRRALALSVLGVAQLVWLILLGYVLFSLVT